MKFCCSKNLIAATRAEGGLVCFFNLHFLANFEKTFFSNFCQLDKDLYVDKKEFESGTPKWGFSMGAYSAQPRCTQGKKGPWAIRLNKAIGLDIKATYSSVLPYLEQCTFCIVLPVLPEYSYLYSHNVVKYLIYITQKIDGVSL